LMDLARGGAQNDIEITSVTRIIITRNRGGGLLVTLVTP